MSAVLLTVVSSLSAVLYFTAFALTLSKKKILPDVLWYCAITLSAVIVINNWVINGYVPFVSMYQVLSFLGLTFSAVYVYIRFIHNGLFMKPYFMLIQGIVMTGVTFMEKNSRWTFPPALQSVYFVPHVLVYMISYSLTAVAFVMTVINLSKKRKEYEKGIYDLSVTAFPFMVSGMFFGALWANECWGEYWSWDTKENWSLMAILALSVYLHFRRQEKLKKYAPLFVVAAFVFVVITLLFVNLFGGNSNHTYTG